MSKTSKKILLVTALADSFRRAGFGFTDKGTALLPEQLTGDQYQQIIGEKRLSVREVAADQIPDGVDTSAIQSLLAGNGQGATTDGTQSTVTANTLAEAFALLDPSNPDHFTQGGKPQLDPLSKMLGRPVNSGERDSAWDAFKAVGSV